MSRWFRWYEGTAEDGKFRAIAVTVGVTPVTVIGTWAMILEDASHSSPRGIATRGIKFWHAILGIERSICEAIINEMEEYGLVTWSGEGDQLLVNKWKERQFEADITDPTAAERMRRHRSRKRNGDETPRYASVTPELRPDTDTDNREDTSSLRSDVARERAPEPAKRAEKAKRGTRLPADWHPSEANLAYAAAQGVPPLEIPRMAERFRNFWTGKAGRDGVKIDWDATWRNWVLTDCERRGWAPVLAPTPEAQPRGPPDPTMPSADELRAKYRSGNGKHEHESDPGKVLPGGAGLHRSPDGGGRREGAELRDFPTLDAGGIRGLGSVLPLARGGAVGDEGSPPAHPQERNDAGPISRVV